MSKFKKLMTAARTTANAFEPAKKEAKKNAIQWNRSRCYPAATEKTQKAGHGEAMGPDLGITLTF